MLPTEITDFKHFIRLIGRGQRAGRTLTVGEAQQAMTMLINGQATPEQKGAFLMLLRVREETAEELAGFTLAFRAFNRDAVAELKIDLDMGCYAGKRRHLPWFLLATLLLAQNGKRIFLHGTHEPDSKRLYLKEVLPQLGFAIATTQDEARLSLDTMGFTYMDLATFNQPLDEIIQLRDQFGLRSCANTLARMLNPSAAQCSLQGVFHRKVDEKHSQTACLLNDANILCFRGEGGEVEFNPERDVTLHIARRGQVETMEVKSSTENWALKPKELAVGQMISLWCAESEDNYAQQAVIGTLATMLVLTEQLSWADAQQRAKQYWQERNLKWPVSLPATDCSQNFNTQGKFYAH